MIQEIRRKVLLRRRSLRRIRIFIDDLSLVVEVDLVLKLALVAQAKDQGLVVIGLDLHSLILLK